VGVNVWAGGVKVWAGGGVAMVRPKSEVGWNWRWRGVVMTGVEGLGLAAFWGVRVLAGEEGGRVWKAGAGEPGAAVEGPNAFSRPKRSWAAEEG
jgi:hypothetical protein